MITERDRICSLQINKLTRSTDISYWKHQVGKLGFAKEIAGAIMTGGVANTGALREMKTADIEAARQRDGALSSKV